MKEEMKSSFLSRQVGALTATDLCVTFQNLLAIHKYLDIMCIKILEEVQK
jgi:hypothetical protein